MTLILPWNESLHQTRGETPRQRRLKLGLQLQPRASEVDQIGILFGELVFERIPAVPRDEVRFTRGDRNQPCDDVFAVFAGAMANSSGKYTGIVTYNAVKSDPGTNAPAGPITSPRSSADAYPEHRADLEAKRQRGPARATPEQASGAPDEGGAQKSEMTAPVCSGRPSRSQRSQHPTPPRIGRPGRASPLHQGQPTSRCEPVPKCARSARPGSACHGPKRASLLPPERLQNGHSKNTP